MSFNVCKKKQGIIIFQGCVPNEIEEGDENVLQRCMLVS